jgi:hypothetical protein
LAAPSAARGTTNIIEGSQPGIRPA